MKCKEVRSKEKPGPISRDYVMKDLVSHRTIHKAMEAINFRLPT